MAPPRCWLVRRDGVDYGPFTIDEVLAQIDQREIDLATEVCDIRTQNWENAATHELFRDYYEKCTERWEAEAAAAQAEAHQKKIERIRLVTTSAWRLILVVTIVVIGGGSWLAWRLMHVEPTGVLSIAALANPPSLPTPQLASAKSEPPPKLDVKILQSLLEHENYDTSGIGVETDAPEKRQVQAIDFGRDGARELTDGEANRIAEAARKGLTSCARRALGGEKGFPGTRVKFSIKPRGIGGITVGKEVQADKAFQACVKAALKRVPVPAFGGQPRKVTIPLQVINR